jgi:hypothetical protein
MGSLAAQAERHYQEHLPTAYAQIKDKATFFQQVEDEATQQIADLTDSLMEDPTPGETFQQAQARESTARSMATSQVMREVVLPEPEETPDPTEQQIDRDLTQALTDFEDARAELPTPGATSPEE